MARINPPPSPSTTKTHNRDENRRMKWFPKSNGVMTIITEKNRMNNLSKGHLMERNIFNYLPSFIQRRSARHFTIFDWHSHQSVHWMRSLAFFAPLLDLFTAFVVFHNSNRGFHFNFEPKLAWDALQYNTFLVRNMFHKSEIPMCQWHLGDVFSLRHRHDFY